MDILHHEGFQFGPISIDKIDDNLYLGSLSAAKDLPTLNRYKITHILTIDTVPLPRSILDLNHITTYFIQLADQPGEDLLSYFDNTYDFIDQGVNKGVVLVHCYFGVSRSASVVIAYIMKKYALSYPEAFQMVKEKRSLVHPNAGFEMQLKLYGGMGRTVNRLDKRYKVFRLNTAAHQVRKAKILPQTFFDLIQPDPALIQPQPEPNVYRCKKCRRVLACESHLLLHQYKGQSCTQTYFIEPIAWMKILQVMEGKLHCPKCDSKVGSFSWIAGCRCPCDVKVAPAFYLVPSKVDFTNVVKNVEMTL